jgi:prephenate dehydrogenase
MKEIRFAIIGCGLMGREFASAAARWMHLTGM